MMPAPYTKVFLTWSGNRSKAVAKALRDWLPNVIQVLKPWMSEDDIDKGTKWGSEISEQLAQTKIGIVCLTPENLDSPWINFEAGALSKLPDSNVCTFLFGLSPADVKFPLAQFQMTKAEKLDAKLLVQTINKTLVEQSLKDQQLESAFEMWWPSFESALKSIPPTPSKDARPKRSEYEMLEELLQLSRDNAKASSLIIQSLNVPTTTMPYVADSPNEESYITTTDPGRLFWSGHRNTLSGAPRANTISLMAEALDQYIKKHSPKTNATSPGTDEENKD